MSSRQCRLTRVIVQAMMLGTLPLGVIRAQTPSTFVAISPCRVLDTRNATGALGGPFLAGGSSRSFPILSGPCGIPSSATAYSLNISVVPHGGLGYITVWPTGQSMPLAATMVSTTGQVLSNAALVPAGAAGAVSVFATNPTDLIFDLNGYFLPQTNSSTQSTAIGTGASSAGSQNTALGFNALQVNSGQGNTATGTSALSGNLTGNNNVAMGSGALEFNTSGSANTALGSQTLQNNYQGNDNTGIGFNALWNNITGANNTAIGVDSLSNNTIGSNNIAIGYMGGNATVAGSYNIEIGNQGQSSDANVIRIGTPYSGGTGQSSTFIAGIYGTAVSGSAVIVNSSGQLGILPSSERFKEDIQDMGSESDRLMQLRPVIFRYKQSQEDGTHPLQYGLIGEEVAKIYPELVVYGRDGQVDSVQYHQLPALLLNELEKQRKTIQEQNARIMEQEERLRALESRLSDLARSASRK